MKFFKKLNKKDEKVSNNSKEAAKERLHLVLMQDRANVSADFLELMKQEIIEVIKKYIDVDEEAIDVRLTNKENADGTNGAPALYANIPILNIKNEARKVDSKEVENKKQENKKHENEKQENKKHENEKRENEEINSVEEKKEKVEEKTGKGEIVEEKKAMPKAVNGKNEKSEERETAEGREKEKKEEKKNEEVEEKIEIENETEKEDTEEKIEEIGTEKVKVKK